MIRLFGKFGMVTGLRRASLCHEPTAFFVHLTLMGRLAWAAETVNPFRKRPGLSTCPRQDTQGH